MEKSKIFIISSDKAKREIVKNFSGIKEAITWAQNYCDLSQEPWIVEEAKTHNDCNGLHTSLDDLFTCPDCGPD